ncbi:GntR family transcriptional regulator [Chelativorans alearense]|uniref:GntR family transcriptional regulator n=1 Tax=Chelativorans alearense TaxID=2681495 RepID=UPI0013D820C4|nr:GntR family transcriptional regulator [Chelativorans alearense]
MVAKPISRASLSTQLYDNLRTSLMDGQYAAGQRLTISGIAEEYGTSITPVREAIFRLVSERALDMRAATSVQVPSMDPKRLREVQKIRIELEGLAAYRAAEVITERQLADLKAINAKFIKAAAKDPAQASILNRDFHFAVLKVADMPILEGICENMWVLMGPFLRMFHDRTPVRQLSSENHKHFDLLAALEARNPEDSRHAMQEDIKWGEELVRALEAELEVEGTTAV